MYMNRSRSRSDETFGQFSLRNWLLTSQDGLGWRWTPGGGGQGRKFFSVLFKRSQRQYYLVWKLIKWEEMEFTMLGLISEIISLTPFQDGLLMTYKGSAQGGRIWCDWLFDTNKKNGSKEVLVNSCTSMSRNVIWRTRQGYTWWQSTLRS